MSEICCGLLFGDEGKGRTVSYLCSVTKNPIVVRYNGGMQCGHTVVHNGIRHIFSSFGSGTLQGVPTYISEYCTFSPIAVLNEFNVLTEKGIRPKLFVHPLCPVTTPFDMYHNQRIEKTNNHGSVGVGFGATIQRQQDYYKLFVQDLLFTDVLVAKLRNIAAYYQINSINGIDTEEVIDRFIAAVDTALMIIEIEDTKIIDNYNKVFEGGQGILLDQDFGFFPNVTRSNTTSKNALAMCNNDDKNEIYYITRTYQTRHGNGFMTNESIPMLNLLNAENETNQRHEFQGSFRRSILDIDLLRYSLKCDNNFSKGIEKNLVITCADQTGEMIDVTINGAVRKISVYEIRQYLGTDFKQVYVCYGDKMGDMQLTYRRPSPLMPSLKTSLA